MKLVLAAVLAVALFSAGVVVADAPKTAPGVGMKPVKVSAADAAGPIFKSKRAVRENDPNDGATSDVSILKSPDGKFEAGLFEAGASDYAIESYPENEFIYILFGGIKLTSADGSVVEAKAGEGLAIPKGWKGRWTTSGYRKYYVTYDEAAPKK